VTADARSFQSGRGPNDCPAWNEQSRDVLFVYSLFDIAGREIGVIPRQVPLRADDTIVLEANEKWRVIAVLGTSATVARA
jgi:hypothetical protein